MRTDYFSLQSRFFAVTLVLSLTLGAIGQTRSNNQDIKSGKGRVQRQHDTPSIFEFHSGFWINLHDFLYHQARIRARQLASNSNKAAGTSLSLADIGGLTPEQQRTWTSVLDYYRNTWIEHDLLFDQEMVRIKSRLVESEAAADLKGSGLQPELVAALERAAPIYRAQWWAEQSRANHLWIEAVTPLVNRFGQTLIGQLTTGYRAKWPGPRIRVDVVKFAIWAGAYTTLDPVHIMVSSTDPRTQGLAALETLLHEASHAMVVRNVGAVSEALAREGRAQNKTVPDDLWHAIIFYTTGEIVRRTLAKNGVADYSPYAYHNGLYARAPAWQKYQRAFEQYWQPYLDGKTDFTGAIANLVRAL
jgi:hypothetical protein